MNVITVRAPIVYTLWVCVDACMSAAENKHSSIGGFSANAVDSCAPVFVFSAANNYASQRARYTTQTHQPHCNRAQYPNCTEPTVSSLPKFTHSQAPGVNHN